MSKKELFEKFLTRNKNPENKELKDLYKQIDELNKQIEDYKNKIDDIGENFFSWYEENEKEEKPSMFNEFLK